jgi:hypothetical protein
LNLQKLPRVVKIHGHQFKHTERNPSKSNDARNDDVSQGALSIHRNNTFFVVVALSDSVLTVVERIQYHNEELSNRYTSGHHDRDTARVERGCC